MSPEDTAESERPLGRVQLGEYIIEGKIGSGGMGHVYKARQPSLDRMVALKVLPKAVAANQEAVDRFYREARSSARLIHPNIVQIYTVGQERGVPFFAMEYVIGEDLEKKLGRGERFSVEEAVGILASVAMALACAEDHSIVHRDIKPGNVMIDQHGVVKVMDFGLAKAVGFIGTGITQDGLILGTPTYMSPEQAEGKDLDVRSDIYSLGVVFYELLCGEPAFRADDPVALIYMHINKEPEPPRSIRPDVPEEVERVVLKCLAKGPGDRYQTARELLSDLLQVQEAVQPEEDATIVFDRRMASSLVSGPGRRPSTKTVQSHPAGRRPRGTKALVSIGAAAAVILAALVALAFLVRGRSGAGGEGEDPGGSPAGAGADPAREKTKAELRLSALRGLLAQGTTGKVVFEDGSERPLEFSDIDAAPGPVRIELQRPYYEPLQVEVELGPEGVSPPFSRELFAMKPGEKLAGEIGETRRAIGDNNFSEAALHIANIRQLDPSATVAAELGADLDKKQAEEGKRWNEVYGTASRKLDECRFEEARALLEQIPTYHGRHGAAGQLLAVIEEKAAKRDEAKRLALKELKRGRFEEARSHCGALTDKYKVPEEELRALSEAIAQAERLKEGLARAEAEKDLSKQRAALEKLAQIAPQSEAFRGALRKVTAEIKRTGAAEEARAEFFSRLEKGELNEAEKALARFESWASGEHARISEMRKKLEHRTTGRAIETLLGALDNALMKHDPGSLEKLIHPRAEAGLLGAPSELALLAASGLELTRSRHELGEFEVRADAVEARLRWSFRLAIRKVGVAITASAEEAATFSTDGEAMKLQSVSARDQGLKAKLDGAGEEGEPRRAKGKVTSVEDGRLVGIDLGSRHGVKPKMIFTVYRPAKVLRLPLVGKEIVVEEERLAEVRVIDVEETRCRAALVGELPEGLRLRPGMLAVECPLAGVDAARPEIVSVKAPNEGLAAGERVKIKLGVRNVDLLPAYYEWRTDGGGLTSSRTAVPRVQWMAPPEAGDYTVTATVVSPLGGRPREIKLKCLGTERSSELELRPARPLSLEPPFASVEDLAFDETNTPYLLAVEGRARRVVRAGAGLIPVYKSSPYRGLPLRIAVRNGFLYVLDGKALCVRRYGLVRGKDPFASPALVAYGSPGVGNGKLKRPVDFAVSSEGDVAVLDSSNSTIQVFGADGRFLQSLGTQGNQAGALTEPVAIACDWRGAYYVLDARRRMVLAFKGGRFEFEFSVASKDGRPADLAYDPVGDKLAVLDGLRSEAVLFTTGGQRLSSKEKGGPIGAKPKKGKGKGRASRKRGAAELGTLSAPSRIVCSRTSILYVLGQEKNRIIDRFDLVTGAFKGRLGTLRTPAFSKLAAAPDGSLSLLETQTGALWTVDRHGWLLRSLAPRHAWSRASALACDDRGDVYVLDPVMMTVHSLPGGELAGRGRFGKKDTPNEAERIPNPIDVAAPVHLERGADRFVAVLLRERRNNVHVFYADGRALALGEEIKNAVDIGVSPDGKVLLGIQDRNFQILSVSPTGADMSKVEVPFDPSHGLAVSPCGVVYGLDMKSKKPKLVGIPVSTRAAGRVVQVDLPRELKAPGDITCDCYGVVYVLDGRLRKVFRWVPRRSP